MAQRLLAAAGKGHLEVFKALISAGADEHGAGQLVARCRAALHLNAIQYKLDRRTALAALLNAK